MQLGTRWTSGDEPPRSLPEAFRRVIAEVDASRPADQLGQPAPRWTLTWLEGRPVLELDGTATSPVTIIRHGWDGLEVVTED